MRSFILFCLASVIFGFTQPAFGTQHPYFKTGIVRAYSGHELQLGTATLFLIDNCKFVIIEKKNRAFYETSATKHDLRVGDSVAVRINGNVVDQVLIERWKR